MAERVAFRPADAMAARHRPVALDPECRAVFRCHRRLMPLRPHRGTAPYGKIPLPEEAEERPAHANPPRRTRRAARPARRAGAGPGAIHRAMAHRPADRGLRALPGRWRRRHHGARHHRAGGAAPARCPLRRHQPPRCRRPVGVRGEFQRRPGRLYPGGRHQHGDERHQRRAHAALPAGRVHLHRQCGGRPGSLLGASRQPLEDARGPRRRGQGAAGYLRRRHRRGRVGRPYPAAHLRGAPAPASSTSPTTALAQPCGTFWVGGCRSAASTWGKA